MLRRVLASRNSRPLALFLTAPLVCLVALGVVLTVLALIGMAGGAPPAAQAVLEEEQAAAAAGACTTTGVGPGTVVPVNGTSANLSAEQLANARAIAGVALGRGLGEVGVVVGIMTAITESTLVNVRHGDGMGPSSRGLFQQMPSWGAESVRMDPAGAAGLFFDALARVPFWQGLQPWVAAQKVQMSEFDGKFVRNGKVLGFGENYRGNLPLAQKITRDLLGAPASDAGANVGATPLPPGATAPDPAVRSTELGVTLTADQTTTAQGIVGVAKGMGMSARDAQVALAAALGMTQLNPRATAPGRTGVFLMASTDAPGRDLGDLNQAATAFYTALRDRGLAGVTDRPVGDVAADVLGLLPDTSKTGGHDEWAAGLGELLWTGSSTGDVTCPATGESGPVAVVTNGVSVTLPAAAGIAGTITAPNQTTANAISAALSQLGTRYSWGGGDARGPTLGTRDACSDNCQRFQDWNVVGFDCAGLMLYAWAQVGISAPRNSQAQAHQGTAVPWAERIPGDMVGSPGHIAMYIGDFGGQAYVVEAPNSGAVVHVDTVNRNHYGTVARIWEGLS